jgi:hypothetical protein
MAKAIRLVANAVYIISIALVIAVVVRLKMYY